MLFQLSINSVCKAIYRKQKDTLNDFECLSKAKTPRPPKGVLRDQDSNIIPPAGTWNLADEKAIPASKCFRAVDQAVMNSVLEVTDMGSAFAMDSEIGPAW
jgi:hypothetical protein